MKRELLYLKEVKKDIEAIPKKYRKQIKETLDRFLENSKNMDIIKVKNFPDVFRLKVGPYRIGLYKKDKSIFIVFLISLRKKFYKKLKRKFL